MNAKTLKKTTLIAAAIVAAAAAASSATHAQGLAGMAAANAAFDAQFNQRLQSMQQQNYNAQVQLWQRHLQVNGPRLRAQYQQYLASGQRAMTFEQFAYWDLMTAAGTNVQGALDAQRRQFEGNQRANATLQSGYANYNNGWWQNQQRQSEALSRYSTGAIRGNANYVDPNTGASTQLPYHLPQGQTYTYNGQTYAQDGQGTYWRQNPGGYGWTRMEPGR
jgi:hypothetical protein